MSKYSFKLLLNKSLMPETSYWLGKCLKRIRLFNIHFYYSTIIFTFYKIIYNTSHFILKFPNTNYKSIK